jgi:hypothetical protein
MAGDLSRVQDRATQQSVAEMLARSPSYAQLDPATQTALAESLATVVSLVAPQGGAPVAEQLAPNLDALRRPRDGQPARPGQNGQTPAQTPAPAPAGAGGPTGRVGELARATLNAINFPDFVASLIQGTFQAIVDASIQQMEAYAELLKNVTTSVDRFMGDNVSDGLARDHLADQYPTLFERDFDGGAGRLQVKDDAGEELPSFFQDLGFTSPSDIDQSSIDEVIVPATRRTLAETRQQTLATLVLVGMNRVVVDDGEILAKLQFHIDASESTQIKFDQSKTTAGNMAGRAGRNAFTANGLMVNTTSLNAQSDINVRADLTGQVKVRFSSEVFPLERFADSAAIQLINSNAKVPEPVAAPAAGATPPAGAVPPLAQTPQASQAPAAPAAATPPRAATPPGAADTTTQELAEPTDPWEPRR